MSTFNLTDYSNAVADIAASAEPALAAVHGGRFHTATALHWGDGLYIAPEERIDADEPPQLLFGGGEPVKAEFIGRDPTAGIALLKPESGPGAPVLKKSTMTIRPGHLTVIAARDGEGPLVAVGNVAKAGDAWRSMRGGTIHRRILLLPKSSPRFEGGAVLDTEGGLVGILLFGPRGRSIVIPNETIARSVETLSTKGHVARGYLGAGLHPVRDKEVQGAIIVRMDSDGPAKAAGLQVGDVITTWDGEIVKGPRSVMWRLGADSAGQSVTLGIVRGGEARDVTLTLGEKPIG